MRVAKAMKKPTDLTPALLTLAGNQIDEIIGEMVKACRETLN